MNLFTYRKLHNNVVQSLKFSSARFYMANLLWNESGRMLRTDLSI